MKVFKYDKASQMVQGEVFFLQYLELLCEFEITLNNFSLKIEGKPIRASSLMDCEALGKGEVKVDQNTW